MAATSHSTIIPTLNMDIRPGVGALYLGVIGAAILYGATNVQIYFYVRKYREDRKWLKGAVAFLWLMDTVHMTLIVAELWHYLIESFGNYEALFVITWSYKAQQLINVIIFLTVQSLYTWRVWKLSSQRNRVWPWLVSIVIMCGYATGIVLVVKMYQLRLFTEMIRIRPMIISAFAIATFNDWVFAVGICHLIYLSTPTLGMHRRTKSMLLVIMRYVLISGMLTSICSLAGLICYCIMPENCVSSAIVFVETKLYVNSYLAMLNARKNIRNHDHASTPNTVPGTENDGNVKLGNQGLDTPEYMRQPQSCRRKNHASSGDQVQSLKDQMTSACFTYLDKSHDGLTV